MHSCARKLGVVQVECKHGLKADDFVSFVAKGIDESHQGTVSSLCDQNFFHRIDGATKLGTVNLSNLFYQDRKTRFSTVLVVVCVCAHRVESFLD